MQLKDAVAIVGMGCVFPDAPNPDKYWENIINRHYAVREIPLNRWDPALYYDNSRTKPYRSHSKLAASVEDFKKDPLKFHIPPVSGPFIERMQFLILESAYQALEDSGYLEKDFDRQRTAVFIGSNGKGEMQSLLNVRFHWNKFAKSLESVEEFRNLSQTQKDSLLAQAEDAFNKDMPEVCEDTCGGVFGSIIASRINNCFNFGGTSLVVDAACASSLAAFSQGLKGLNERKFDTVLAGGIDGRLDIGSYIFFSSLGAISDKGSFPFDERADGFIIGEGAGAILLKRLEDAMQDGDKIYAVIRNIGTSSDGRAKGITAPDMKGQIRALERTYEELPFTPDTVSLIEAHGTGTWIGDKIELASLIEFFSRYSDRKQYIGLGSVKSMIGHLKSGAGVAGIIKTALALYNRILPPTINCEQPRKDVDWKNSPFYLITEAQPWESNDVPRRAAVDAFGFGGINYHAVLEEAPAEAALMDESAGYVKNGARFPAELIIFRASTRRDLLKLVENTRDELVQDEQLGLHNIAAKIAELASPDGATLAIVAADTEELISHINKSLEVLEDTTRSEFSSAQGIYFSENPLGPDEKIAFLFPGQGSQYLNMGGDMADCFPFVGDIFREVDNIAHQYTGNSMLEVLIPGEAGSSEEKDRLSNLLNRPDYNHPAMLAMVAGILQVLERAGVKPDMVAGHSLGEYFALYAAGVFDMNTAINLTTIRGEGIVRNCFQNGSMASINMSEEMLEEYKDIFEQVGGFITVANKNCPAQTVISGDVESVEKVVEHLEEKGIQCKILPVTSAYHTKLLLPAAESFRKLLNTLTFNPPGIPVQSNLSGRAYETDGNFTAHLRDVLVEQMIKPVEFISNVLSMYEDGARLFIEIGPKSTLSSFVDNILSNKTHWTISANIPHISPTAQLLHTLAFCAAKGLPVDISRIRPRQELKSPGASGTVKPQRSKIAVKQKDTASPDLIREILKEKNPDVIEKYLNRRSDFLKDMISVDFEHFTGLPADQAEKKSMPDDGLEKQIIELISRKSGYPEEVINIDFDVEAELGLDSIKQVEIIREAARELNIDFGEDLRSQRYKITTPRKLIEICRDLIRDKTAPGTSGLQESGEVREVKDEQEWQTDCHRWTYEKIEVPLSAENRLENGSLKNKRCLLLTGSEGPGRLLQDMLEEAGAAVYPVLPADNMRDLPEDFDIILNMWSYNEDDRLLLEKSEKWWQQVEQRASSLLTVGQKLAHLIRQNKDKKTSWIEVTSLGGEMSAGIAKTVPARAGIGWGMMRCLTQEFKENIEFLCLDLNPDEPVDQVAGYVLNELMHCWQYSEIGYTDGKRYEIRWKIDDLDNHGQEIKLDSQSVVLAIGGARGITASICRKLAEHSNAQFIIVGKSPLPPGTGIIGKNQITFETARAAVLYELRKQDKRIIPLEIEKTAWRRVWENERAFNLKRLEDIAGKVVYRQCDITDHKSVKSLINEIHQEYRSIDLVIQGASDLIEKATEDITAEEFIGNMRSKALGTACLLSALSDIKVGTFINFSSVAGRWGNMGQASYAAGHELAGILVAGMRRNRTGRWINVFFGPWLNVGMIRIGAVMERLRVRGNDFITHETGGEYFIKELTAGSNRNVAFCGNTPLRRINRPGKKSAGSPPGASLLEKIDIVSPEIAEGYRILNMKQDRIVAEHHVGYENPVLPGVVSLEMIAQAASVLTDPGFSVTDINDIVFPHPGIFPHGEEMKFYVRVSLVLKDNKCAWFNGKVFSNFVAPGSTKNEEMVHASCRIRFGYREAAQKPSLLLVSTGVGDYRVDAKDLWETKMRQYRKGMYRTISSVFSVTRDGVIGEIKANRISEFCEKPKIGNLMQLDGTLDLINLSTDIFYGNESSLVGSIKDISFYVSDDSEEKRFCRTRIRELNERDIIYDVEAMDSTGKVTERASYVQKPREERGFNGLNEPIWKLLRENPRQKEIKDLLGYDKGFVLAQISISHVKDTLETDEKGLLNKYLSGEERERYRGFKHIKRRLEWLAGRIIAKDAVRMYLDSDTPAARAVVIRSAPDEPPCVDIEDPGVTVFPPYISITHSGDAAAVAAAQDPGIGIDVQEINESILEIADTFSTPEERELISACNESEEAVLLAYIWAMKEASRKAAGTESCTMKELSIKTADYNGNYIVCELYHLNTGTIRSVVFQNGSYVYAVSSVPGK
ncbi:MAG: SDR family NAD(P)-dependent oxidoreductase [Elusimicrobiota bacterium]